MNGGGCNHNNNSHNKVSIHTESKDLPLCSDKYDEVTLAQKYIKYKNKYLKLKKDT
jgi:hypothetical protein